MKINEKNLCLFATTPPYDFEGFLNKRGEVNKAFQRRYFVLKGNLLFYFEKKGDREPLGLIVVEGCTIELSEESDQYCFQIVFNGNRTYVLCADSQELMEAWMKVLTCAGYEYKKLMVAELQRQLDEIENAKKKLLSESVQATTPKPPPRRQNPFNRPAPPPPPSVISMNGLPGHLPEGENSLKTESSSSDYARLGDTRTSPLYGNIREAPRPPVGSVKNCQESVTNSSSAFFREVHERLRKEVLADVQEYRAQRELTKKPLIEF